MSNRLEIEIRPPNEWGVRMALIRIDQRPLLELVTEFETPVVAAAGEPDLAGKYGNESAPDVIAQLRFLLRSTPPTNSRWSGYQGKVALLECECGCDGCWPLLTRVSVIENEVTWSNFEQPHRPNWIYPGDMKIVFDRKQYEKVLILASQPSR